MTKGKDTSWEWAAEWSKAIKTFPDWTPDVSFWSDSDHPVLTRLCTYSEMGLVWAKLYEWWSSAQKNRGKPYIESLFDGRCVRVVTEIALQCTAPELGLPTLTPLKRRKLIEKTTAQVKALSKSLRELVVPESISYYIDWETRFEEVREKQIAFLLENFLEEEELLEIFERLSRTHSDDHEPFDDDSMGDFQEPLSEEQYKQQFTFFRERFPHHSEEKITKLLRLLNEPIPEPRTEWDEDLMSKHQEIIKDQILRQIKIPSKVSVYDILNRFMEFENFNFPEPVVKKWKGKNQARLLTIRLFAQFLNRVVEHDPRSRDGREVIARLAGTVLDDSDIFEGTVKEALKQYEV